MRAPQHNGRLQEPSRTTPVCESQPVFRSPGLGSQLAWLWSGVSPGPAARAGPAGPGDRPPGEALPQEAWLPLEGSFPVAPAVSELGSGRWALSPAL